MLSYETDVLVVGAGPAGLTASALLARSGISSITVTKYGSTAESPRAHITNQRTMEVMRDLGIEESVAKLAMPQNLMGAQIFATSFAGVELSRTMAWGAGPKRKCDYERASPSWMCNISQHDLEPVLLEGAKAFGADIRFNRELAAIQQDEQSVVARIVDRETNEESEIRAKYVIAADGGRSTVASQLGFEFDGQSAIGEAISVWLDVDLTKYTAHRSGAIAFICPQASDIWMSIWPCVNAWDEWNPFFFRYGWAPGSTDEDTLKGYIREAIGDPAVPFQIKKIARWQVNHVVAKQYRQGRVFLAGDAAHRHSPANGLGSNTSIQDSYNLVWKLGLVLNGKADASILETYDQERQPVGKQVVDRAIKSHGEIGPWSEAAGLGPDMSPAEAHANLQELFGSSDIGSKRRDALHDGLKLMDYQFNALGVELGQRYRSDAIASTEPFPAHAKDPELFYEPSTVPGCYIPHAWLEREGKQLSTIDLATYGSFTLITGPGGESWSDAAAAVSEQFGVEIQVVSVGLHQEYNDVWCDWAEIRGVRETGALLVRPDRFVAWRSNGLPENAEELLRSAMQKILGKDGKSSDNEQRQLQSMLAM